MGQVLIISMGLCNQLVIDLTYNYLVGFPKFLSKLFENLTWHPKKINVDDTTIKINKELRS